VQPWLVAVERAQRGLAVLEGLPRPTLSDVGITAFAISGPLVLATGLAVLAGAVSFALPT
jgi:hypothetical protein